MQLLRADADFRTEAELTAIRKPRRRIDIHRCRIHLIQKTLCIGIIFRHDGFGMTGAVFSDMADGFVNILYHPCGNDIILIFGCPVRLRCRHCTRNQALCGFVPTDFDFLSCQRLADFRP